MGKRIPVINNVFNKRTASEIKSIDNVFGNFLVNSGLYREIEITEENVFELADLIGGHVKIDVYCPECGERRVFSSETILCYSYDDFKEKIQVRPLEEEIISWQHMQDLRSTPPTEASEESWSWNDNSMEDDTRVMIFKFSCAMDNAHHLDYIVLTNGNKMKKIGQYPSVADLSFPELKEYRNVMTREDEKELRRAVGLFASGIGVGSFVYLRRIFERIIATASDKAIREGKVNEESLARARVDEKIKLLTDYLPKSLVDNTIFYGIISKGIHELSEEECLEYFPVMQSFIMMILRQWEKIRKDEEEEKKLATSLNSIASKVK